MPYCVRAVLCRYVPVLANSEAHRYCKECVLSYYHKIVGNIDKEIIIYLRNHVSAGVISVLLPRVILCRGILIPQDPFLYYLISINVI